MMTTDIKPMYEFSLWRNCNNNCAFCFHRHIDYDKRALTFEEKELAVKDMIRILESDEIETGSDVLLVGGELYSNVSEAYKIDLPDLFYLISRKILEGKIRYLYTNSNLLYIDLTLLSDLISAFDGCMDKLKLITSFDIAGRFNNANAKELFLRNIQVLKHSYPDLHLVVNSILTKPMCEAIVNNEFNPRQFSEKYQARFHALPYVVLDESLKPSEDLLLTTIVKLDELMPGYFKYMMNDLSVPQVKYLHEYDRDQNKMIRLETKYSECGHNINFTRILDDKSCYICKFKRRLKAYKFSV